MPATREPQREASTFRRFLNTSLPLSADFAVFDVRPQDVRLNSQGGGDFCNGAPLGSRLAVEQVRNGRLAHARNLRQRLLREFALPHNSLYVCGEAFVLRAHCLTFFHRMERAPSLFKRLQIIGGDARKQCLDDRQQCPFFSSSVASSDRTMLTISSTADRISGEHCSYADWMSMSSLNTDLPGSFTLRAGNSAMAARD